MSLDVLNGCDMKDDTDVECKGAGVCGPRPELVYSYATLLELKCHPLAQIWPPYLDQTYKNLRGYWDPDRWHLEQKRSETPACDRCKPEPGEKGKERDKVKVDKDRQSNALSSDAKGVDDAIILSPQRGSFLSGCHAVKDELNLRPDRPDQPGAGAGAGAGAGRRVGSGRILNLRPEKEEFPPNRGSRTRNERENSREWDRDFSKYGFRRETDEDRRGWDDRRESNYHQHDDRDRAGGGGHDRRVGRGRGGAGGSSMGGGGHGGGPAGGGGSRRMPRRSENEPEWMNESVSLADIIELKGFDDSSASDAGPSRPGVGKSMPATSHGSSSRPSSRQSNKSSDRDNGGKSSGPGVQHNNHAGKVNLPMTTSQRAAAAAGQQINASGAVPSNQQQQLQDQDAGFNFDQIMEVMNMNSLLGGINTPDETAAQHVPAGGGGSGTGTGGGSGIQSQSRFSQFFKKPPRSRKSSIQEEIGGSSSGSSGGGNLPGQNILREMNGGETLIKIPSPEESNKYFTPISPAAKTGQGSNVLLDMLQKNQQIAANQPVKDVQKLEDRIKRSLGLEKSPAAAAAAGAVVDIAAAASPAPPPASALPPPLNPLNHHHNLSVQQQGQPQPPKQNDLSAFMKLVAQVKGLPNVPAMPSADLRPALGPGAQPPVGGFMPGLVRPTPISQITGNMPTEQEILEGRNLAAAAAAAQRMNVQSALPPQLLQFLEHYPLNPEAIKRPEADHLLTALNNGSFPLTSVIQQLSNPNLQPRQRELILAVLKLKTLAAQHHIPPPPPAQVAAAGAMQPGGVGGHLMAPPHLPVNRTSPLLTQPPPPPQQGGAAAHARLSPLMFGVAGGNSLPNSHLAVSPGPQNQRVPSPQEMTVLTQQILQQALIKKKLEEQKENYRKKHEGKSEDKENIRGMKGSENGSSGSPLAFTPTSVMRKNAAERKDSDPKPNIPELKAKSNDRPGSLELSAAGRTTRSSTGQRGPPPQSTQPPHPGMPPPPTVGVAGGAALPGAGTAMPQMPPNLPNPLLFLTNPGVNPAMLGGGMPGFGPSNGNLNALIGAGGGGGGGGRFPPHPHPQMSHHGGNAGMRVGPPSPGGVAMGAPPSIGGGGGMNGANGGAGPAAGGASTLSRFFSNDVLAAAAQGARTMKMPPLPTGQAMTLEEIERSGGAAATVKI